MTSWREVSGGVFVGAYQPLDINVCAVAGSDGLLVVDTRTSPAEAAEIEADLSRLGLGPVRWVVNTHAHFDHTFGNQHFGPGSLLDVPIYGHRLLPEHLDDHERPRLTAWLEGAADEPDRDWGRVVITPPTDLVAAPRPLQLGGRTVELLPLGPGHTDNDLVVHIADVHTWIVGDVVEASGPPMYGSGCFPLDWPTTLAGLAEKIGPADVVVPGHGPPVTRDFVLGQLAELSALAAHVRALHDAGMTVAEALATQDGWAFPPDGLGLAVTRAFAALDADARSGSDTGLPGA